VARGCGAVVAKNQMPPGGAPVSRELVAHLLDRRAIPRAADDETVARRKERQVVEELPDLAVGERNREPPSLSFGGDRLGLARSKISGRASRFRQAESLKAHPLAPRGLATALDFVDQNPSAPRSKLDGATSNVGVADKTCRRGGSAAAPGVDEGAGDPGSAVHEPKPSSWRRAGMANPRRLDHDSEAAAERGSAVPQAVLGPAANETILGSGFAATASVWYQGDRRVVIALENGPCRRAGRRRRARSRRRRTGSRSAARPR
jgi:hypothetical protein